MSLIVLCPSYDRPENAKRLYESFEATRTIADTQLWFVPDTTSPKYEEYYNSRWPLVVEPEVGGKNMVIRTNSALNTVFQFPDAHAVGWLGDDMIFRTKGWDERIVQELKSVPIVYANDLFQEHRKAQSVFMHRSMAEALGWICPPWSYHLYVDDAWVRLSEKLHGKYLEDVIIEHMHPYAQKAEWDESYLQYNTPEFDSHDGKEYRKWLAKGIREDVRKVRKAWRARS